MLPSYYKDVSMLKLLINLLRKILPRRITGVNIFLTSYIKYIFYFLYKRDMQIEHLSNRIESNL